jgi:hypothetical protein
LTLLRALQEELAAHGPEVDPAMVVQLVRLRGVAFALLNRFTPAVVGRADRRLPPGAAPVALCWAGGGGCFRVFTLPSDEGRPRQAHLGWGHCHTCRQRVPQCRDRARARAHTVEHGLYYVGVFDNRGRPLWNPSTGLALGIAGVCSVCGKEYVAFDRRRTRCNDCHDAHRGPPRRSRGSSAHAVKQRA